MMPITISSETRPPAFMTAWAFLPTSVWALTAARSMSPVESWGIPRRFSILGPWVPFPAPGGPKRICWLVVGCWLLVVIVFVVCSLAENLLNGLYIII